MDTDALKRIRDAYVGIIEKKKLDPVNKKAVKKDFDGRNDKDIDNDGDVDSTDKYLHKRRKAITKAIAKEEVELAEAFEIGALYHIDIGKYEKGYFIPMARQKNKKYSGLQFDQGAAGRSKKKPTRISYDYSPVWKKTPEDEIPSYILSYLNKSEEVELDEAKDYEIKNNKIHISKANFRKVHKDFKNATKGKERMMALHPKTGATTSFPVVFTENFEVQTAKTIDDAGEDKALSYGRKKGYKEAGVIGDSSLKAMVLFNLRPEDKSDLRGANVKSGEKVFRYATRQTVAGDIFPLIKVNLNKGMMYFLTQESSSGETDEIKFETRGVKLKFARMKKGVEEAVSEKMTADQKKTARSLMRLGDNPRQAVKTAKKQKEKDKEFYRRAYEEQFDLDESFDLFSDSEIAELEELGVVFEKKVDPTKGATKPEEMLDKSSPKSKEFIDKHETEEDDTLVKSHDDASKAGRVTKQSPARNGDQLNVGDRSVVK